MGTDELTLCEYFYGRLNIYLAYVTHVTMLLQHKEGSFNLTLFVEIRTIDKHLQYPIPPLGELLLAFHSCTGNTISNIFP
jgi:hypothetical protein